MQNHQLILKKYVSVFCLTVILLFSLNGYCQDSINKTKSVPYNSVCITPEDAGRLVIDLDKEKTLDQINKKLEEQNSQLLNQTKIYENQVKLLNEKYAIAESLVVKNEELYKTKESALQKDLDEARKPRWGAMGGSLGLGAILTLIAVLLL